MSKNTSTIVLWLFVINLGIAFGAGRYEHTIVVSRFASKSKVKRQKAKVKGHLCDSATCDDAFREWRSLRHYLYMSGTESGLNETSLRQRLKRETAAVHRRLEAELGLLDPSLDVHRYVRVLGAFYGFYVPVEIDVTRLVAAELPLGFPLRARAELIERDLLALGLSPADLTALHLCSDRPELSCVEDLAGCLYVLEGACLGGQVLSPLLQRRLGLAKASGAAFFAGDEEGTLHRWTVIVAWLDGLPRTGASSAKIISAATTTFDAFARWAAVAREELPWSI